MAIQVNQYQKIRMYYEQEHRNIRWIARELNCSRDTVRKHTGGDTGLQGQEAQQRVQERHYR